MTLPMEQAIGLTPKYGAHIAGSNLCGSCHTVATPSLEPKKKTYTRADVDKPTVSFHEQTTYFEWRKQRVLG